jgi:hypothetical protein
MKTKMVIANCSNPCWKEFKKGRKYNVLKSFFYNGEGHYKLTDGKKVFEAPDCFFDDDDDDLN